MLDGGNDVVTATTLLFTAFDFRGSRHDTLLFALGKRRKRIEAEFVSRIL
jgi:hypothetical protein